MQYNTWNKFSYPLGMNLISMSTFFPRYGQGVSEDSVMEEIEKYIPQILQWVEKYMAKDTSR